MRLSNKAAKMIFAIAAILLLSISYILYLQIRSILHLQDQLNDSNIVKLKLKETLSALKDAETAQRGYLLTNDSLFLEPFNGAYEKARTELSSLKAVSAEKVSQQRDLNSLETLVNLRFNTFNQAIQHYNDPGINDETRKQHLLRGKSVMDSIRMHVQNIELQEDQLVRQREKSRERFAFVTPMFAVLLMMTAIGILVFSYSKIIEQLNRLRTFLIRAKKMNNELKKKNHQLEMINNELDSFTYIASHDLKEPLRKILTYIDLIEKNPASGDGMFSHQHFSRIKTSAQRMQNLLNDLLLYSHVNMGERKFEMVDLNKVVSDVTSNLKEEIQENGAKIQSSDLPTLKGMPFQIRQLFENLITNSLKYKQQGRPPSISIESTIVNKKDIPEKFLKESNAYYKLNFTDNGSGFDQTYADKVFRLFQRLHPNNGQGSTGIGLTICKKIVDNHHGHIRAVSEVNKGTTFEIYLPAS